MVDFKMRILFVSVEVDPFAKVGGLADVAHGLPKALAKLGHDVRIIMPAYKMIEQNPKYNVKSLMNDLKVPINPDWSEKAFVLETSIDDAVPVYLMGSQKFFSKATSSKLVYDIDAGADPYLFFDRGVPAFIEAFSKQWRPQVIHCNDWHTGFIPVYLRTQEILKDNFNDISTLFTIHNLAYQGDFDRALLWRAGLSEHLFSIDYLEAYNRVNFLKGGLVFSDISNTVSPNYALETQTQQYGCGLHGLIEYLSKAKRFYGILNGIDDAVFNPETDTCIPANFSADKPNGKAECKRQLQAKESLPEDPNIPIIGFISRLSEQKGLDIIKEITPKLLSKPIQWIILGTGDKNFETYFKNLQKKHPHQFRAHIEFNAPLAQQIYAGSDLFLMPSRFEPCGLGQMIALRYGSIPIVRKTGGLADSIIDVDDKSRKGNGFVFEEYSSDELYRTVARALKAFENKSVWQQLTIEALRNDFSWTQPALKYVDLYKLSLSKANK